MILKAATKYGVLQGVRSNAGYALFRGVPYAAPPVGELRWRPPQDPEPWEGVRMADTFGPACMQFDRWHTATDDITDDTGHSYIHIPNYPHPPRMSEDCLYLNIYTPANSPEDKLPVMMYIHGGGLQQWYGSDYEYCGDGFCCQGIILVSITYRLNVFGFYTHPELEAESEHHSCGNYGILDMLQALKWLRENIAQFGGDPENITCFGQSGGARATAALCCSPLAKDYIAHASIQSGGGVGSRVPNRNKAYMYQKGIDLMAQLGCTSIAEMRSLPAEVLQKANNQYGMRNGFNLYPDGWVLPKEVDECFAMGLDQDVDLIIGCTADEGANDAPSRWHYNTLASIYALGYFRRRNGKKPVYAYVFDQQQPGEDHPGVPHSCDNRYQFGTLDGSWRPYTKQDWELSLDMRRYWANFARTGNPNGPGMPCWEPFDNGRRVMRLTGSGCKMGDYNDRASLLREEQQIIAQYEVVAESKS